MISCLSAIWLIGDVGFFVWLSESDVSYRNLYILASWGFCIACLWIGIVPAAAAILSVAAVSLLMGFTPIYEVAFLILLQALTACYSSTFVRRGVLLLSVTWVLAFTTAFENLGPAIAFSGGVLFAMIASYLIGLSFRRVWQRQDQALADAQRAKVQRDQSLKQERHRLAGELHDVVAHEVTLIAMRAEAAVLVGDDQTKDDALQEIRSASRNALVELRRTVDTLRDQGSMAAQGLEGSSVAFPEGLEDLVGKLESSGVSVGVQIEGDWTGIPLSTRKQLSRTLQENVTNIMKHGSKGAREDPSCWIEAGIADDGCYLRVRNRISAQTPPAADSAYSSGVGLDLIRSRVNALGGEFSAGLDADGLWASEVRGL